MSIFSTAQPLLEVVRAQKNGEARGTYSICSANPFVIEACMQQAALDESFLLIESTCNQVNQFGGYTGMTPVDFTKYVTEIADRMHFPTQKIILGGDHLGPNPWQNESAEIAMDYSRQLVSDYVLAGFTKIHLDASIPCIDEKIDVLDVNISAQRTADLCAVAEKNAQKGNPPVYIVGTEVPVPGGETTGAIGPKVTSPDAAKEIIELFHQTFKKRGIESAWQRVIGLVVQPGVEFGDNVIYDYNREEAKPLSRMIESIPEIIYEAHSTDYQQPLHLRQMVEDHFAILKVGPSLTFAMREAIFALAHIENEYLGEESSRVIEAAERVMQAEPKYWKAYYSGSPEMQFFARKYSLSDRIRYYWPKPDLQNALARMLENLSKIPIPLSLLSQYMPDLYGQVREGTLANDPHSLIHARIRNLAMQYDLACRA
jgi:D-tagatose-1,6-bisphosphate aldolase subunit GatZ/KbaZ